MMNLAFWVCMSPFFAIAAIIMGVVIFFICVVIPAGIVGGILAGRVYGCIWLVSWCRGRSWPQDDNSHGGSQDGAAAGLNHGNDNAADGIELSGSFCDGKGNV